MLIISVFTALWSCALPVKKNADTATDEPYLLPYETGNETGAGTGTIIGTGYISETDSIKYIHGLDQSSEILFYESTSAVNQAIFTVRENDSPYYDALTEFYSFIMKQPGYRLLRLSPEYETPDSVQNLFSKKYSSLEGLWIPLHYYKSEHYVYMPCGVDNLIYLSGYALYDMPASGTPGIISFNSINSEPAGAGTGSGTEDVITITAFKGTYDTISIHRYTPADPLYRINESVRLFRFVKPESEDRLELMVKISAIRNFPLIVNECSWTEEGVLSITGPDGFADLSGFEFSFTPLNLSSFIGKP